VIPGRAALFLGALERLVKSPAALEGARVARRNGDDEDEGENADDDGLYLGSLDHVRARSKRRALRVRAEHARLPHNFPVAR